MNLSSFFWRLIQLIALIGAAATVQGCSKKIEAAQATTVNGLVYKLHDTEPYTGEMTNVASYQYSASGGTCTVGYSKGRRDGKVVCSFQNGKKIHESEWSEGRRNGVWQDWHEPNGNLVLIRNWRSDKQDGLEERYNPYIGKLISQTNYTNGEIVGEQKIWDPSGKVLLVSYYWKDGKKTGFSKFDNTEAHYRNGELHGVRRVYETPEGKMLLEAATQAGLTDHLRGGAHFFPMLGDSEVKLEEEYKDGVKVAVKIDKDGDKAKKAQALNSCMHEWGEAYVQKEQTFIPMGMNNEWRTLCEKGQRPG